MSWFGEIKNNILETMYCKLKIVLKFRKGEFLEACPLGCASCGVSFGKPHELCEMFSEVTADVMILGGEQLAAKLI